MKVTLKSEDGFYLGWCARTPPPSSPCSHLYQRSPVDQGYLGGPASFCNWTAGKVKTANMTRPTTCSARYLVRLECRNVSAGTEITWNYGSEKEMPIPGDVWFLDQVNMLKPIRALTFPIYRAIHSHGCDSSPYIFTNLQNANP